MCDVGIVLCSCVLPGVIGPSRIENRPGLQEPLKALQVPGWWGGGGVSEVISVHAESVRPP